MAVNTSPGALTKVSLNGTAMAVISCSLGKREMLLQRNGLRGYRSHIDTDVRKGPQRIGGTIGLEPSAAELVALMALAIGTGGNATDDIPSFSAVIDRVARVDTYAGCKISRATISGQQGGIISCSLDIVGKTEAVNTGTVATPASTIPYILSDLVLTLINTARQTQSFSLVIDNHIDAERFLNSVTLDQVIPLDRTVTLTTTHPYNDANIGLYDQAVGGSAGILALNNGTTVCQFDFGKLQLPAESVDIPGKAELMLTLNMIATKVNNSAVGTTDEIQFSTT
jgi:hypothetical protein